MRRIAPLALAALMLTTGIIAHGQEEQESHDVLPDAKASTTEPDAGDSGKNKDESAASAPSKTLFEWSIGKKSKLEEEEPAPDHIVTDRPHFSEASSLVGLGRVQIESGYTFFSDGGEIITILGSKQGTQGVQTHSFPETLFRLGVLAEWFELRIGYNYLIEETVDADGTRSLTSGSDDLYLGAKLALTEQEGFLPEMALFPQARIPSGSSAYTSGQVLPGFNLAYSWRINKLWELECNTQLNRRRDGMDHFYTEFIQTANLEWDFTEKFGGFTEWFCFLPDGALEASPQHYFHGGLVYRPQPNVQFDIHAAVGLNRHSDDFFGGPGLCVRF